jgi:ubiquinone biosynthesis protein COQ9
MTSTKPPSSLLRTKWLEALLPEVPFDGWTRAAATAAAEKAGLTEGEQALAAPNGVPDLIAAFFDAAQAEAAEALEQADFDDMRTPEKVAAGLKAWLGALEPNREAVRRAAARGFMPWGAGGALQRAWSVSDMVWSAAGDVATDYNRYSKRGLLTAVIPTVVMYWLDGPEEDDLDAFIMRRLTRVSGIGRTGGRVLKPLLGALQGLRSGKRPGSGFGR